MEGKITTYLFYMGVIFSFLTMTASIFVFQKSTDTQLINSLKLQCEYVSENAESEEEISGFASDFCKTEIIRKEEIGNRGESFSEETLKKYGELIKKQGYATGIVGSKKEFCFCVMPFGDAYVCVYSEKPSLSEMINNAFPYLIMILVASFIFSAVISVLLAEKFMNPIRKITEDDFVFRVSDDNSEIYEELIPILNVKSKAEKMKRQFTANVSHELKTPLTSISGYAQLIESEIAVGDDVVKFASVINKESQRMLYLVGDILKLSELEEEHGNITKENIDLFEISKTAIEALGGVAQKTEVSMKLTGEATVISGNKNLIYELIYNLCDNAIRYNKPGGSVLVTTKNRAVTVSDTGIGIDKKYHSRIFERFYRVDKSRSKQTGGTGLGLSIVKHIAEIHDGKISITSEPGEGTQIKVAF